MSNGIIPIAVASIVGETVLDPLFNVLQGHSALFDHCHCYHLGVDEGRLFDGILTVIHLA